MYSGDSMSLSEKSKIPVSEIVPSSLLQQIVMSAAAFLTMIGCGLGDTLMNLVSPPIGTPDGDIVVVLSAEQAAQGFIDALVEGNYLGASRYLCEEAKDGFFASDPTENTLLGADTSGLMIDITYATNGNAAILNFCGGMIPFPRSDY